MARKPHPKAEIEAALKHAEQKGWRIEIAVRMLGARCIPPTTMQPAAAESFASPASGARRGMPETMRVRFGEW